MIRSMGGDRDERGFKQVKGFFFQSELGSDSYCLACSETLASFIFMLAYNYVPVKSKLKHSPLVYPGHLTSFPGREGGNLINLVFPGTGHLITTHTGWGI